MTNMDKLYEAVEARGPVCVGLDTDFSYLPADFVDSTLSKGENIVRFNKKLIDATKAVAGCYKVQIAYYEALGLEGLKAYADTLKAVREAGVPVIADIKRGDIAKTAEMYAMGHFAGDFEADFVTLAPYMGLDSISPYLPYAEKQGKGMFVLCRTSNGGAKDFEYEKLADGRHVYDLVGDKLNALGKDYMGEHGYSSIGLVIGGTHIEEATEIRAKYQDSFFLIPGYGAQGRQGRGHRPVSEQGQRRRGQLQPRHPAGLQEAAGRGLRRGRLQRVCEHEGGHCPCVQPAVRPLSCAMRSSRRTSAC